ncbi:MAG: hypothetical protein IPL97_10055 [Niastella sp.]|nr:hypothetical protein [Niastella sp.]
MQNISIAQNTKPAKTNLEVTINEVGDAVIHVNTKYNASYWEMLKQMGAFGASVIKNGFKRVFPKYELTDFEVKSDDMERTIDAKFKVLGMVEMSKKGKWIADLSSSSDDTKDANITKLSEKQFLMIDDDNGQTFKINLPAAASNSKIEKDSFGKAILTYSSPVPGGGLGTFLKYFGILLMLGGLWLLFKSKITGAGKNLLKPKAAISHRAPLEISDLNVEGNNQTINIPSKKEID